MDRRYGRAALVLALVILPAVLALPDKTSDSGSGWRWKSSDKPNTTHGSITEEPSTFTSTTNPTPTNSATTNSIIIGGEETTTVGIDVSKSNSTINGTELFQGTSEITGRSASSGLREGRIINDSGKKLNIKGYIPIVSLDDDHDDHDHRKQKADRHLYHESGPYPPQPIPGHSSSGYSSSGYNRKPIDDYQQRQVEFNQQSSSIQQSQVVYPPKPEYKPPTPVYSPKPEYPQQSEVFYQQKHEYTPQESSVYPATKPIQGFQPKPVSFQPKPVSFQPKPIEHRPIGLPQRQVEYPTRQVQVAQSTQSSGHYVKPQRQLSSQYPFHAVSQQSSNNGFTIRDPKYVHEQDQRPSDNRPVYQDQKAKFAQGINVPGQGFDQEALYELSNNGFSSEGFANKEPCICVPFYLCKDGYLSSSGRGNQGDGPTADIDERSAPKSAFPSNSTISSNKTSVPKAKRSVNDTEVPAYAKDIMSRFVGADSCGLLRRCCRVPPSDGIGLSGFESAAGFPAGLPGFGGAGDIANDFNPQELPQHIQTAIYQQQRPVPDHINGHPGGHPGGHLGGHRPQRVEIGNVHGRPDNQQEHFGQHGQSINRPVYESIHRPVPEYVEIHARPIHRPPISTAAIGPGGPQFGLNKPYPGPNGFPQRPPIGSGIHGGVYTSQSYQRPVHQPIYTGPGIVHQKPVIPNYGVCGSRNNYGVHGRVNNLAYREDSTDFGEYPWHVGILKKLGPGDSLYVCGGTLIGSQWVLTAAHCLKKYNAQDLKIRIGEWDVHREDEFYPHVEKFIGEVFVHPDFFPGNLKDDVALLRLDSPVDLNQPHIAAACLAEPRDHFAGQKCFVTGWGKDAFGNKGEYQNVLKEVDVPVLEHRDCEYRLKQTRLGPGYQLDPGFLCAGGEPGKDACTGDGGSPLVCDQNGVWKVVGVVSWGIGCGQAGIPGVYVNVARYREWIDSIVGHYG